jgi:hypothetical protein
VFSEVCRCFRGIPFEITEEDITHGPQFNSLSATPHAPCTPRASWRTERSSRRHFTEETRVGYADSYAFPPDRVDSAEKDAGGGLEEQLARWSP